MHHVILDQLHLPSNFIFLNQEKNNIQYWVLRMCGNFVMGAFIPNVILSDQSHVYMQICFPIEKFIRFKY
jgi:hypothetical protein